MEQIQRTAEDTGKRRRATDKARDSVCQRGRLRAQGGRSQVGGRTPPPYKRREGRWGREAAGRILDLVANRLAEWFLCHLQRRKCYQAHLMPNAHWIIYTSGFQTVLLLGILNIFYLYGLYLSTFTV